MSSAALFPAPMALMTVAPPVVMSPPAQTPFREVLPASSTTMVPHRVVSSPGVFPGTRGFGVVPTAMMTVSTSTILSEPSRRRASASRSHPARRGPSSPPPSPPPSPGRLPQPGGFVRKSKITPSSLAFSISSSLAGISASDRRYTTWTALRPQPDGAPRRVHGDVPAADDRHPLPLPDGGVVLGEPVGLHQ